MNQLLKEIFHDHNITYTVYKHQPVFHVEEAQKISQNIPGAQTKNLFLVDKNGAFFLISIIDTKRIDLKKLCLELKGNKRFSFGNETDMWILLGLKPGSVSPYGLINDKENKVQFIIDKDIFSYKEVNFHPLQNDMTINTSCEEFLRFCTIINHPPQCIHIPTII
jgi:Ala-tRNA(Pro) deacylase